MNSPKIVSGNLLNTDYHIIIQQLNCLCVKPHGLSESIAKKYPYANVYEKRQRLDKRNLCIPSDRGIPGNITVSGFKEDKKPIVIGLYGQFDFGKPYFKSNRPKCEIKETREQREIWFQEALDNLLNWLIENNLNKEDIKIGLPYLIGCGLAGGKWENYLKIIEKFTEKIKCQVEIIKLDV